MRLVETKQRRSCFSSVALVLIAITFLHLSLNRTLSSQLALAFSRDISTQLASSRQGASKALGEDESQVAYKPSVVEDFLLDNAIELGYFKTDEENKAEGCPIWTNSNVSRPIYDILMTYRDEVKNYQQRVQDFRANVKDLRLHLDEEPSICDSLKLHEGGLEEIFKSGALSYGSAGYVEPLFPPLRDPEFCFDKKKLMSLDYIVHDFPAMCRKLKRTSRTIFVDMGASLDFHAKGVQPAVYITKLYEKFGFHFDHIYAYEVRDKKPRDVFNQVPEELLAAYHWINVGVSKDPNSKMNPLRMLLENYNEDDFVVIKLDIDTSSIEVPLVYQILEDARMSKLIDSFYFEHHVHLEELKKDWKKSMEGSVGESMTLFRGLRERGISAHYWV